MTDPSDYVPIQCELDIAGTTVRVTTVVRRDVWETPEGRVHAEEAMYKALAEEIIRECRPPIEEGPAE